MERGVDEIDDEIFVDALNGEEDGDGLDDLDDDEDIDEIALKFNEAAQFLERLTTSSEASVLNPPPDVLLKLYGLYKVATVGKCLDKKPGFFDPRGRAKWSAWQEVSEMSSKGAMEEYVKIIEETYELDDVSRNTSKNTSFAGGNSVSTLGRTQEEEEEPESIFSFVKEGSVKKIINYIEQGNDLNIQDKDGLTPLHWAVDRGFLNITQLLLTHGANKSIEDSENSTPLDYAITCEHQDLIEILS